MQKINVDQINYFFYRFACNKYGTKKQKKKSIFTSICVCVCVCVWAISIIWYIPQDPIKFIARYTLSGRAWTLLTERKVFFTRKRNFGRDIRQAQWASDSGSVLHGAKTKSRTYVQGNK
jgi:hypothetical protein